MGFSSVVGVYLSLAAFLLRCVPALYVARNSRLHLLSRSNVPMKKFMVASLAHTTKRCAIILAIQIGNSKSFDSALERVVTRLLVQFCSQAFSFQRLCFPNLLLPRNVN